MAAGDMNWSDCGRKSNSQFFYGRKQGRRQVGRCGQNETRTGLYAKRLTGRWKKLFRMKFDREPSDLELWFVLRTGEIAENVKDWEKQPLKESAPPTKPLIHRGRGRKRMTKVLGDWIKADKDKQEALIKVEAEEEESRRIQHAKDVLMCEIRTTCRVPIGILRRIVAGTVDTNSVRCLFGVDEQYISIALVAWGLKEVVPVIE